MRLRVPVRGAAHFVSRAVNYRRPQLAYVGGWRGHENLGDETLFEATSQIFPSFKLVPVRGNSYEARLGRFLPAFQAAVLAGGTLINKSGSLPAAEMYSSSAKAFFVFGSGVASPAFWAGRWTDRGPWQSEMRRWAPILDRSVYVGVRGPISAAHLRSCGIDGVEVVGDPVLALAGGPGQDRYVRRTVGLNLGVSGRQVWGDEDRIAAQYVRLATAARRAGWEVHWFVVWPGDLPVVLRVADVSGTAGCIHQIYTDPHEYLRLAGRMSVFFGMKLHAVALATCAFVPSIMLEYRPKCRDYMASLGQEGLTVRSDRLDGAAIWQCLSKMDENRDRLSAKLRRRVLAFRDLQRSRAAEVVARICASAL